MVKFGGKIGTLYQMLKNAFKKHPLQNRTNVQIKGGGVKGLLNNVQKNCTFLKWGHPLVLSLSHLHQCIHMWAATNLLMGNRRPEFIATLNQFRAMEPIPLERPRPLRRNASENKLMSYKSYRRIMGKRSDLA